MLESFGVITSIMPCDGGWHYDQPLPQGGFQRIPPSGCAGGDGLLVQQVKQFRANLNIPVDGVEEDIAEFLKRVSPFNNRFPRDKPKGVSGKARPIRALIERIRDWLMVVSARQPRLLIEDDAARRAAICANCPQNIEWRTGCLPCCDEVIQRGRHLRQRVDYPHADSLKGCRLHSFYLPAAVFVDRDYLPDPSCDAPEACWLKTEPRTHAG